jgi:GGDEF domain-containing protein
MKRVLMKNSNEPSVVKGENISIDRKLPDILFVPLSPDQFPNTIMVFGLKKSAEASAMKGVTGFCNLAYQALQKGRTLCEKASTNNLDIQSGLYNSAAMRAIIKKSLKKGLITVVASIEVANLRDIKFTYDEQTLDQCVKELAYHLDQCIEVPAKIGRIDDSRFMVVFSSIDTKVCETTLYKVIRELSKKSFSLQNLNLSINIGMAESHMNETRKRLIQRADLALNEAIAKGTNKMEVFHTKIKLAEAIRT